MKKTIVMVLLLTTLLYTQAAKCQTAEKQFTGAQATLKHYKALYVINSNDPKKISGTLRNLNNALDDPRLSGKLEVELIAFGDGVAVYEKSGTFEETLKALQAKGVLLAQCENTVRERHIDKNDLFPFISFVPSGNGEIIIRHYQGWAVVHP
ncbi:MAG: DsrE family protein [Ginsengibacter sp.]